MIYGTSCTFTDKVFPCIDVMRVALRNPAVNKHFCNAKTGPGFLEHLFKFLDPEQSATNQTVALRALANLLSHGDGQNLMIANCHNVMPVVTKAGENRDKNVQVGASTVLMNIAVALRPTDDTDSKSQLLAALITLAMDAVSDDASFRICTALGTLVWKDEQTKIMAISLDAAQTVEKWKGSELKSLKECAKFLHDYLLS